jgi:hypothetical protein
VLTLFPPKAYSDFRPFLPTESVLYIVSPTKNLFRARYRIGGKKNNGICAVQVRHIFQPGVRLVDASAGFGVHFAGNLQRKECGHRPTDDTPIHFRKTAKVKFGRGLKKATT